MGLVPTKADLIFDHTVALRRRVRGTVAIIPEAVCCPRTAAAGSELMCFLTKRSSNTHDAPAMIDAIIGSLAELA